MFGRYWTLLVMTLVYAMNIADRFGLSTLIEPIKREFKLSDSAVGFLTGVALAIFYVTAGLPLGLLADRVKRTRMIFWALALWSIMTALCGFARTFWQLLIARIGVGIGEAGGTPPSHSIIADCFAPKQRVAAMSVYALGIALGSAVGGIAAGWIAEHYGWRSSLMVFGLAGLPLALLLFTVREPVRGAADENAHPEGNVPLGETLKFIGQQRALLHILAGGGIATFSGLGIVWWTPAFLSRSHGLSVGEAGTQVGLMSGVGGAVAMVATFFLMVYLATLDPKWQCRFVGIVVFLITIPAIAAHLVAGRTSAILLLWLFIPFTNVYVGPTLALLQNLVRPRMRGITVAILLFTANVANLVFAPQLIGIASDILAHHLRDPNQSLRVALAFSAVTGFWAAYHFWAAERSLREDLAHAGSLAS